MSESVQAVIEQCIKYTGYNIIIFIFLVSIIYITVMSKHKRKSLIYPTLILIVLVINPILYKYLWVKLVNVTYWRMLWLLPIIPVTAYAITLLIRKIKNIFFKSGILLLLVVSVVLGGNYMYKTDSGFIKSTNQYKIPQEAIDVTDKLLEIEDHPKVVVPESLFCYIRQYSSDIKLFYGRDIRGYIDDTQDEATYTFYSLMSDNPNYQTISRYVRENGYTYFVSDNRRDEMLTSYGFEKIDEVDGYIIYKDVWTQKNRWSLNVNQRSDTGEYYISVKDAYGRLAIIDGGSWGNTKSAKDYVDNSGGIVNCWVVTNLRSDYAGLYVNMLTDYNSKIIEARTANYFNDSFSSFIDSIEDSYAVKTMYKSMSYKKGTDVRIGDRSSLLGMDMRIFNAYNGESLSDEIVNDSSMVFKCETDKNSFIYVSNISEEKLNEIILKYGDELKSTYLIVNNKHIKSLEAIKRVVQPKYVINISDENQLQSFELD